MSALSAYAMCCIAAGFVAGFLWTFTQNQSGTINDPSARLYALIMLPILLPCLLGGLAGLAARYAIGIAKTRYGR